MSKQAKTETEQELSWRLLRRSSYEVVNEAVENSHYYRPQNLRSRRKSTWRMVQIVRNHHWTVAEYEADRASRPSRAAEIFEAILARQASLRNSQRPRPA